MLTTMIFIMMKVYDQGYYNDNDRVDEDNNDKEGIFR